MKKLLVFLLLFTATFAHSQQTEIDSLLQDAKNTKVDTTRILDLAYVTLDLRFSNPEKGFLYSNEGLKLANKIDYLKGQEYCKVAIAWCEWGMGNYTEAIELILPFMKEIDGSDDFILKSSCLGVLASAYRDQGFYSEALKYVLKGMRFKSNDIAHTKLITASAANLYMEIGNIDSAKRLLHEALRYPVAPGNDGYVYSMAGKIYSRIKQNDSALLYYHLGILEEQKDSNVKDLAGVYNGIATFFYTQAMRDSAIFYAREAKSISDPQKFVKETMDANLLLAEAFDKVNADSALYYYKKAMVAKDTLYSQGKQHQILNFQFKQELQQQQIENEQAQNKKQEKIYLLLVIVLIFIIVAFSLFRNIKHKQEANILLQEEKQKVERTLSELKSTQQQLIQAEKMASLGELTAGIAHEIQNPLNFVNNFSDVNKELLQELKEEADKGNIEDVKAIADDVIGNEEKINHHGKRADAIVKGMLQHSRQSSGQKEPIDINALADEYLRLSYHGLRAKDKNFNAEIKTDFDESIGKINIIPQDIGRVFLNLFNNAFYAVNEQKTLNPVSFNPTVSVKTEKCDDKIYINVKDNGNGIPQKIVDKIFQPFFTTKPTGEGTGLGLSLSYDIIRAQGGTLKVESTEGEGSEFIIIMPADLAVG